MSQPSDPTTSPTHPSHSPRTSRTSNVKTLEMMASSEALGERPRLGVGVPEYWSCLNFSEILEETGTDRYNCGMGIIAVLELRWIAWPAGAHLPVRFMFQVNNKCAQVVEPSTWCFPLHSSDSTTTLESENHSFLGTLGPAVPEKHRWFEAFLSHSGSSRSSGKNKSC